MLLPPLTRVRVHRPKRSVSLRSFARSNGGNFISQNIACSHGRGMTTAS
jgi:hypothetical protein